MRGRRAFAVVVWTALFAAVAIAQAPASDEEVARRQLESGRSFARQGNYAESLKDFRAVADTHGSSSVADNALLEIARYYLDIAGDTAEAETAVQALLKKYPTSDSAPDAYVLEGRLALARSHQGADLDAALANFDRVSRLFPASDAVPQSFVLAGETLWYAGRFADARASLARVEIEYPANAATASAYLEAGRVLVSLGDPVSAMEEMQQVRNRWPKSGEAATALARLTLLHRLYVRARSGGPAYAAATETVGPAKLENVVAVMVTPRNAIYYASQTGLAIVTPANAEKPPASSKPRGLTMDAHGALFALEAGGLRSVGGGPLSLNVPRVNEPPQPLNSLDAAVQMSNGDWIVGDGDQKSLQRFKRSGEHAGAFAQARVSRLAINGVDEIAGLDRDQKGVVLFDATGKITGRIPAKGAGYDLQNPEDLAFDTFGHLYVLDREAIAVFSPYVPAPAPVAVPGRAGAAGAASAASNRGLAYRLVTLYTEPEKNPGAFRKATAFALDQSGAVYLYDDKTQRIRVYR